MVEHHHSVHFSRQDPHAVAIRRQQRLRHGLVLGGRCIVTIGGCIVYIIYVYIYIVLVCLPCCVDVLGLFSHLLVAQVCTNMY